MNRRVQVVVIVMALIFAIPLAVAVGFGVSAGEDPLVELRSVAAGSARSAEVEIELEAGNLRIGPGADGLMDGAFIHGDRRLEPVIDYAVDGDVGRLAVRQALGSGTGAPRDWNRGTSVWGIRLGDDIPVALEVALGAGTSTLHLGDLDLLEVRIATGAGTTTVDFDRIDSRDLTATIEAGAGDLTIVVPRDVGVVIRADVGLGRVSADGLFQRGDTWANAAYGSSSSTLAIEVVGGVGNVSLVLAPPA